MHSTKPTERRTGLVDRARCRWPLAIGTLAGGLALAACSSAPAASTAKATTTTAAPTTTTTAGALCPLTGAPVPGGGGVPQRPALAVKVDNYVAARPQSGLDKADIIFEEPVEGGITRFVAVFQCQGAALVGPVRSARNIDIGILGQFGAPLEAHVGGIQPVIDNIDASPIINLDLGAYASVDQHPAGRVAPYDTYASTGALWGLKPTDTTPPAPIFRYTDTAPTGFPVANVSIPFSSNSNVVWHYNPQLHAFQRYYGLQADTLANGVQNTAANVLVQYVQITYGPWAENSQGGLEVQANLYNDASGPAELFRSGVVVGGTWSRSSLAQPTEFTAANGQPMTLQPGQTWVELVPNTVTVSATAPTTTSTTQK
jgi:Protein of unknown function (DUF3048) N-terminal domain/Protein of unknown function (DUF3048) C-terminal domain